MSLALHTERALRVFPKLSFYLPPPARHKTRGITITEDTAAILWMLELCTTEQEYAAQADVRSALGLRGDHFSRLIVSLSRAGCVLRRTDERSHRLKLTAHGRAVLHIIKIERAAILRDLLEVLPNNQRKAFLQVLETVADAAWMRMQARTR